MRNVLYHVKPTWVFVTNERTGLFIIYGPHFDHGNHSLLNLDVF